MKDSPPPLDVPLGGDRGRGSMTTWCAGLLLLVTGCLCVSYLRFAISGMRVFAGRVPCGDGRRSFGHSVRVGLAHPPLVVRAAPHPERVEVLVPARGVMH